MSIELDKLMNLADGKVLYDDLRDRLKQATVIASEADILAIINDYGKQDEVDEDAFIAEMVLNTIEMNGETIEVFESVLDYTEIVSQYLAGKHVVFHFPAEEVQGANTGEALCPMVGYYAGLDTGEQSMYPSPIAIIETGALGDTVMIAGTMVSNSKFLVGLDVQEPETSEQGGNGS